MFAALIAVTGCKSTIKGDEPFETVEQLSAQSGFGRAFVSWSGVSRASRYRLLESTNAAFADSRDPALAYREESTTSTFQEVEGLSEARTVWFAVIAVEGSNGATAATGAISVLTPGSADAMGAPLWRIVGKDGNGELGAAVSAAGDVNGDGYADVVVGEPDSPPSSGTTGAYRVYPGGVAVVRTNYEGFLFFDDQRTSLTSYGATLGAAGDVDGDGYDDLLVGAAFDSTGFTHDGSFWLVHGDEIVGTPLSERVSGTVEEDRVGASFAALTLPGGTPGFAVGRPAPAGVVRAGEVLVFAAAPASTPSFTPLPPVTSTTNGSAFGASLAAIETDADAESELAVGEPLFGGGLAQRGRVVLRNGATFATNTETVIDQGTTAGERFGTRIAAAGDVNDDGADDLLVTSSGAAPTAFLLLGPEPFVRRTLHASSSGDLSIAGVGDVDGDGFDDVLVGEPAWQSTGRVLLFRGGTNEPGSDAAWIGVGDSPGDRFGAAVAGAGDVDADGFPDIAIGAPGTGTFGRLELFRGHRRFGLDVNGGLPQRVRTGATVLLRNALFGDPLGNGPYTTVVNWGDGTPESTFIEGVDCFEESLLDCQNHAYGVTGRFSVRVRVQTPDGRFGEALTTIQVVK